MDKQIWTCGQGEAIIFIHGLVGNHTVFKEQVAALSKCYYTVAYDMLGHGAEKGIAVNFEMANLVNELLAVYNRLQIQQANICSLSFGTYIANEFAYQYPEKVTSLCHIGASYDNPSFFHEELIKVWNKREIHYRDWLQYYACKMNPNNPVMRDPYAYKSRKIFQKYGGEIASSVVMQALHYMLFGRVRSRLSKIKRPFLWVMGEYDHIRKTCLYDLHDILPEVIYIELPGTPHVAHLYQTELFNQTYQRFLLQHK
ncbi:alpha/beta hydrolase [Aneurinibacillus sp. Ricciae_BoGa-3]|uniref:alpha/beta fold hydrolase n=1 Tax=Aneurinibacillus sp. Ricciae_BoGa-3 TaxID=3022697 RepID=UPI00233FBB62|nr:alpha/beta hydrolase [Aneurinibacillus sp. Ricciae_BoGa-3]WCK53172.1 alpha/beta hydrolase [Aneurinibacillus sp. Ricciae_BoGa-3]